MGSATWKAQILDATAGYKKAIEAGDFSKYPKDGESSKYTNDELRELANDFPKIKTVLEDQSSYHQGLNDEYQSVTDDLESGSADNPTSIERVKSQGEKMKTESIANIDASTERVLALIEGLPDDQQQKAADFWVAIGDLFIGFWGEILTQVEQILESVIEWLSQIWEQVRENWSLVKAVWTQIWAWLGSLGA